MQNSSVLKEYILVTGNTPDMIDHDKLAEHGYKIFAVSPQRAPRTLVHGRPNADVGGRTRTVPRDVWIESEEGKPPFHLFRTEADALCYLPRFRVRAPGLMIARVRYHDGELKARSHYLLASWMHLSDADWQYALENRPQR